MTIRICLLVFGIFHSFWGVAQTNLLAHSKWFFKGNNSHTTWMDANVPGNVHTDLFKLNKIPDPHVGTNESDLQWISAEGWIYKTNFEISEEVYTKNNFSLDIESIDTHAKLYLNNHYFFSNRNQFIPLSQEIKKYLKVGDNELRIEFEPSTQIAQMAAKSLPYTLPGGDRVFVRKAQYQFGWDWSPTLITYGIGNISIQAWENINIKRHSYTQKLHSDSSIDLTFTVYIESDKAQTIELQLGLNEQSTRSKKFTLQKGINPCIIKQKIKQPIWWWCNGLGSAYLYTLSINVFKNKTLIDQHREKFGIRTIEWVNEQAENGESFYLKLNGKPVFMKGANYIPPHHFLNNLTPSVYTNLVANAAASHMNMLRVWGGGVYAPDIFYEACDSLGILVWQDFMFACAMYPSDTAFLNNVAEEVLTQTQRLQNHTSIAIWCGNNENAEGWHNWGWQKQFNYSVQDSAKIAYSYYQLFDSLIPSILKSNDPNRFYWPSSPAFGWGREKSLSSGDLHYWGVWWGMEPFETYQKKVGRFVSEFGFQALPSIHSLKEMKIIQALELDSVLLKSHQKHPKGFETINTYLQRDYPKGKNIAEYVYLSQLVQAKGMKIAMESHRAAKPYCMGSLYWQLNDCWPVVSWSGTDFFLRKKALQYQIKKNFAPYLLVLNVVHDSIIVQVISDKLTDQLGTLQLILWKTNGQALDQQVLGITIEANSNKRYAFALNQNLEWKEKNEWVLQGNLLLANGEIAKQSFYFTEPKNLKLPDPKIQIEYLPNNEMSLYSEVFIKDLALIFEDKEIEVSDNYFDLMPFQKEIIKLETNKDKPSFTIQSLNKLMNP